MDADTLARPLTYLLLLASIALARLLHGWKVTNIPLWSGCGVFVLYVCYSAFGLEFANGRSALAELAIGGFVLTSVIAFSLGTGLADFRRGQSTVSGPHLPRLQPLPRLSRGYMCFSVAASLLLFLVLTEGQPWRVVLEGVELKWVRLAALSEKDPLLLNLDALAFGTTLFGMAWSILSYRDDKASRSTLLAFLAMLGLYLLSTGSRTPVIAAVLQVVPAIAIARHYSRSMKVVAEKTGLLVLVAVAAGIYMVVATAGRIEFEGLDQDVFRVYFGITDFGLLDDVVNSGNSLSFLFSTAVVYAASTVNNVVIRIQDLAFITPTMGYKFVFFYVAAIGLAVPESVLAWPFRWRDLATENNDHLLGVSPAATQWATPYGDLVWDFGLTGAFLATMLAFALAGWIVRSARLRPSFAKVMLSTTIVAASLSPLVNPLLSLHIHYMLWTVAALVLMRARRRGFDRRLRQRPSPPTAVAGP